MQTRRETLPSGFHRIRSYGFLGNRHRAQKLARCRQLLGTTTSISLSSDAGPTAHDRDDRDRPESLTGAFQASQGAYGRIEDQRRKGDPEARATIRCSRHHLPRSGLVQWFLSLPAPVT